MKPLARWLLVAFFAVAMAWVETASVYYIRLIVDRVDPYQPNPLPVGGPLEQVELVREAATLVMLFAIGAITGRTWRARLGYTAIAFGVWDIFYYVFLTVISGWPTSVFDWDILFLLPLPWWGPVLAPVSIALLMIAGGTLVTGNGSMGRSTAPLWRLNWLGVALALYVFMEDSARALPQGIDATRTVLPASFDWPVFMMALAFMAAPVAHLAWRTCRGQLDEQAIRS
jgi:hypothetical protein